MGNEQQSSGSWRALDALVDEVVDTRRQIAALQAKEAAQLARAVDLVSAREREWHDAGQRFGDDLPLREVSSELGAAMRLSDRSVQARMGDAALLLDRFPAAYAALAAGEIDLAHARAIVDAGGVIADDAKRADYEARALAAAADETPFRLSKIVKVLAARIDPDTAAENIRRAHEDRTVRLIDLADDTARVIYEGPAVLAHAIYDRLSAIAHHLTITEEDADDDADADADADAPDADADPDTDADPDGEADGCADGDDSGEFALITGGTAHADTRADRGDTRTMDQKRADILADILLTGAPAGHTTGNPIDAIQAKVQITIPVLTLLGHSRQPALLAGYGPIDLSTAKRLAASAPGWDRVLTDPYSGEPMSVDRYRPTAALARFLDTRDEHCRFPGCTQPVWHCDHDHTIDAARGGPTSKGNLANFCRRHHIVKHHTLWRVEQIGHGRLRWTSPTGRIYIDTPVATVQFVPEPLPPF
nr:HNH endonuclease signature motif containing protein [Microbacterium bovistercoris]